MIRQNYLLKISIQPNYRKNLCIVLLQLKILNNVDEVTV